MAANPNGERFRAIVLYSSLATHFLYVSTQDLGQTLIRAVWLMITDTSKFVSRFSLNIAVKKTDNFVGMPSLTTLNLLRRESTAVAVFGYFVVSRGYRRLSSSADS